MVVMMGPNYEGTIMALQLYRRHRTGCEGGRPEDFRSGQFEEGRRGWKQCACLIHTSGSIAGKSSRRSTGERDWEKAQAVADGLQFYSFCHELGELIDASPKATQRSVLRPVRAI